MGDRRLVTVAGGKLTGYRPMAIDVVDRVAEVLADRGVNVAGSPEATGLLPGGDIDGEVWDHASHLGARCDLDVARRLASLYGSEAAAVLERGAERLTAQSLVVAGEVDWAVEVEGAATLEDVYYRRTRAAWYDPAADDVLDPMARRLAARLGWDDTRIAAEIATCRSLRQAELAFQHTG